jgi:hypothetical protein
MAQKYIVSTKYVVGTSSYDTTDPTLYYSEADAQKHANKLNTAYDLGVNDTKKELTPKGSDTSA